MYRNIVALFVVVALVLTGATAAFADGNSISAQTSPTPGSGGLKVSKPGGNTGEVSVGTQPQTVGDVNSALPQLSNIPILPPVDVGAHRGSSLMTQYASMTGALAADYAKTQGLSLGKFVASNTEAIRAMTGVGIDPSGVGNLEELNAALGKASFVYSLPKSSDFATLKAQMVNAGTTPDGIIAANAAAWAAGVGGLKMPDVNAVSLPATSNILAQASDDALLFGLFANKTVATIASEQPNLFAQISASGLSNGSAAAAFSAARAKAGSALENSLSSTFASPCHAGMLAAMASGSQSQGAAVTNNNPACQPCVAAGAYLSTNMSRLVDPRGGSLLTRGGEDALSAAEWGTLPDWQKNAIYDANPGLRETIDANLSGSQSGAALGGACNASAAGAANWVGDNFGAILNNLR